MMFITVKAQKDGLHFYGDAPKEVAYLRTLHRHMFHVEAELQVFHSDRELEFFMVQKELQRILDEIFAEENYGMSCEYIAANVQLKLDELYPFCTGPRQINVRVSEDGENGVYLVGAYKK